MGQNNLQSRQQMGRMAGGWHAYLHGMRQNGGQPRIGHHYLGAMEFTYSDGTWNPENHQYEDVGWIPNEEDGNRITIENTGKVTVNVSVCYTPDYSAVSGSFADLEGTVIESPVALPVNGKKSVWLILKGKPDKILNHTVIGTITVTLGGN